MSYSKERLTKLFLESAPNLLGGLDRDQNMVDVAALKAAGAMPKCISSRIWAEAMGLKAAHARPKATGKALFFWTVDLWAVVEREALTVGATGRSPLHPPPPPPAKTATPPPLDRVLQDFTATVDALYAQIEELTERLGRQNAALFRKLDQIEVRLAALAEAFT